MRFKKSKSFCTLIPERGRTIVLIVFGGPERKKAEAVLRSLTPAVREAYRQAPTYHDGKWVVLSIDQDKTLADIQTLLGVKRTPDPDELVREPVRMNSVPDAAIGDILCGYDGRRDCGVIRVIDIH